MASKMIHSCGHPIDKAISELPVGLTVCEGIGNLEEITLEQILFSLDSSFVDIASAVV